MMITRNTEEPGFETDVNEIPEHNNGPEDTLEDKPVAGEQKLEDLEEAQKEEADKQE